MRKNAYLGNILLAAVTAIAMLAAVLCRAIAPAAILPVLNIPNLLALCVIALVLAVPITFLTVKGYQRLAQPEPPTTTVAESLVGREGVVTVATEVGNMKGKVRIGSDTWSATSDVPIEAGESVVVESSEGVHVHVRRL